MGFLLILGLLLCQGDDKVHFFRLVAESLVKVFGNT